MSGTFCPISFDVCLKNYPNPWYLGILKEIEKFALMEVRKSTLFMGFLMLLGALWLLVKPTHQEKPVLSHITVPHDSWKEIQVSLNDYPLHNEDFMVEVNSRGIITKVNAKQQALVDLLLHQQTIPYVDAKGKLNHYNTRLSYRDRKLEGLRSFKLAVAGD